MVHSGGTGDSTIAVIGDVHGHLQLALCMAARWQRHLGVRFEAVFLCGDVGTFTDPLQLDSATVSHARHNECELEFLQQWSVYPQGPWLEKIFEPSAPEGDGLGLCCPVVMVHGNHDGFAHLQTLFSRSRRPVAPVPVQDLRGVDSREFIRYLPSGWKTVLPSGLLVAGVGGMEAGQRRSKYHPLAYIEDGAVEGLLAEGRVDVLVTHQGPASVQGPRGQRRSICCWMRVWPARGFTATARRKRSLYGRGRLGHAWWYRWIRSPSPAVAGTPAIPVCAAGPVCTRATAS